MAERQLRLFDPPKPLLDRFGAEFFRLLPSKPGVYLMLDARDRVIYVGQSKNLRQRLASYKNAHPETTPRKIIRLIQLLNCILHRVGTSEACREARSPADCKSAIRQSPTLRYGIGLSRASVAGEGVEMRPSSGDWRLPPCPDEARSYNAAMLDIKVIREKPDHVRQRLATRGAGDEAKVDEVLALDEKRRSLLSEAESLKAQRNRVSKEIGALMAQKKPAEAEAKKDETRRIGDRITELDRSVQEVERARDNVMLRLPNIPDSSVTVGHDATDNPVIRSWGMQREFSFVPKSHIDLCEHLKLIDFARGAKLSGSGFLLYTHWGARLERALVQFLLDLHTSAHGYTEVSPPFIVKTECMVGTGQFPKAVDQAYAVQEGEDTSTLGKLYLVPTAETPVANIHREELLKASQLPINYCAYSPCFRAEAGAAGVGTRGMIRVHQFDKVELIKVVTPETGYDELEKMVGHAETVLQKLGLHYRVIQLCTGDMGFTSAKTYDIEVWAPGQGQYLEVSSCSNCEEFQARRMNLRFKTDAGENRFPHILNGSGTALARLFVALIETYQQDDGSIAVPEILQPYLKAERIGRD